MGSPPPTRGTLKKFKSVYFRFGITPAYAGNTGTVVDKVLDYWDHPRLRGEHFTLFRYVIKYIGSPPPTRGTLL